MSKHATFSPLWQMEQGSDRHSKHPSLLFQPSLGSCHHDARVRLYPVFFFSKSSKVSLVSAINLWFAICCGVMEKRCRLSARTERRMTRNWAGGRHRGDDQRDPNLNDRHKMRFQNYSHFDVFRFECELLHVINIWSERGWITGQVCV